MDYPLLFHIPRSCDWNSHSHLKTHSDLNHWSGNDVQRNCCIQVHPLQTIVYTNEVAENTLGILMVLEDLACLDDDLANTNLPGTIPISVFVQ